MMSIATDEALGSISIGARTIGEKAELLYFFLLEIDSNPANRLRTFGSMSLLQICPPQPLLIEREKGSRIEVSRPQKY
jgi:hypothetical protein